METTQHPDHIYDDGIPKEWLERDWKGRTLARTVTIHVPYEGHVTYAPGDEVLPEHYKFMGEHCFRPIDPEDEVRSDLSVFAADGAFVYDDLRVAQLVELCRQRSIEPRSNKKADLIRALTQSDGDASDIG